MILATGRIALSHTAQELGVCSSKNISLKDRSLIADQLSSSIGPLGISLHLWEQVSAGFHLSRPLPSQLAKADCCWERPDWPRPSAQSRAREGLGRRLPQLSGGSSRPAGGCKSCPFELGQEPRSPPEQGLGRPGGSRTACTALRRCCCEVTGMGSGPADGNRFDVGINGEALRAPTAPIRVIARVPPRPEGTRDPLGSGAA